MRRRTAMGAKLFLGKNEYWRNVSGVCRIREGEPMTASPCDIIITIMSEESFLVSARCRGIADCCYFHRSVLNDDAGSPSVLNKTADDVSVNAYLTAAGCVISGCETTSVFPRSATDAGLKILSSPAM